MMLQRNLYILVLPEQKGFVLVGTEKAIYMAVSNNKIQQRNTMLSQRLKIKK